MFKIKIRLRLKYVNYFRNKFKNNILVTYKYKTVFFKTLFFCMLITAPHDIAFKPPLDN